MEYRVIWSPEAVEDLESIAKYIEPKSCNWQVCRICFAAKGADVYHTSSPWQQSRFGEIANPEGQRK